MSRPTNTHHDSAVKHIDGSAIYIDDIKEQDGTLHAYLGTATIAHGAINALDLAPVLNAKGVVGVLTLDDLTHGNDISPTGLDDEPIFANGKVAYFSQPLFAVIAKTRDQARNAAQLAIVDYTEAPFCLDVASAQNQGGALVTEPLTLSKGDIAAGFEASKHQICGKMTVGGQDHFYLEGHIALAVPGEDEDMLVYSSTQHPSEVQHMVAHALGVPSHGVVVEVRRMGGGFGGKETQSNIFAVVAALSARKFKCPVKLRPDRELDMEITGKRHDFVVDYHVGFDDEGRIQAVDCLYAARCGFSADLSGPVTDRALFHADNCYYFPNALLKSAPLKTNTVSNTAFRGFGGPQGLIVGERIIEEIGYALKRDPLEIRKRNFYADKEDLTQARRTTPYHQIVNDNIIAPLVAELEAKCDYQARRDAIFKFNKTSPIAKRGIALTPVKFGISFTATWYNQAGALVHIYRDGSIRLNHGGTEMGQGLNTKIAQIVAEAFAVPVSQVKITATTTEKVPNTSATAASSGSDLNGMAALDACNQIKARLGLFAALEFGAKDDIQFEDGHVCIADQSILFADFIEQAYQGRVQLSAAGFYKTPDIYWDRKTGQGNPFYYFAYGAAASEVEIDTLTGEYQVLRTDILHDVGKSINPAIDIGQIEGGFVQGMGWLTTEELRWDAETGALRTNAPATYKIPLASDIPKIFNVTLADWSENTRPTIKRSKAVGEPPFMLAVSVLEAMSMAVASVADYQQNPRLNTPATPEAVLKAVQRMAQLKAGLSS